MTLTDTPIRYMKPSVRKKYKQKFDTEIKKTKKKVYFVHCYTDE